MILVGARLFTLTIFLSSPHILANDLELPPAAGSSGCNLSTMGGRDRVAFNAFDINLRAAAVTAKAQDFLPLIQLPLIVQRDERRIKIKSAEQFIQEADQIFTPAVREGIKNSKGFFCKPEGLLYRPGTWVAPRHEGKIETYAVQSVYVGVIDPSRLPTPTNPETLMVCDTQKHHILIEDLGKSQLRYRAWSKQSDRGGKPDLQLLNGLVEYSGTGGCGAASYTFKNGNTTYEVSGRGCGEGADEVTGYLSVTQNKNKLLSDSCRDSEKH